MSPVARPGTLSATQASDLNDGTDNFTPAPFVSVTVAWRFGNPKCVPERQKPHDRSQNTPATKAKATRMVVCHVHIDLARNLRANPLRSDSMANQFLPKRQPDLET
jgi:hypothetical protein